MSVKTGDASRTLVGVAFMGAGSPGTFQGLGVGTMSDYNHVTLGIRERTLPSMESVLFKVAYPITGDFTWGNQGGAAVDDQFGFTRLSVPSASTSIRSRLKSAPSTPYQVDLLMRYRDTHGSKYGGLLFRESSTGKLALFQFISTTNSCQVVYFSNDTTLSSNPANTTLEGSALGTLAPVFLRIRDDGTNVKFIASRDGKYYFTEMSVSRTAHMAGGPNQIGFFGNMDSAAGDFALDVFSWGQP